MDAHRTWIPGSEHAILTTTPQMIQDGALANKSDNGQLMHVIVVPGFAQTITATFDAAAPIVTPQAAGTLGNNGRHTGNVSLTGPS